MITEFAVAAKGVGRRDYTGLIEHASVSSYRSFQTRANSSIIATQLVYPAIGSAHAGVLSFYGALSAPSYPFYYYHLSVTGELDALTLIGLYRFASIADLFAWNWDEWYGDAWGYHKAELDYANGIRTEEGKLYAVMYAQYSVDAISTVYHVIVNGLIQEVVV